EISGADLIYMSGGKPGHLLSLLLDSAAGAALREAHARGAVIAGCSAGAMVLGGHQIRVGGRGFLHPPIGWEDGLGMVPGIVVVPHYDAIPETLIAPLVLAAPDGALVVGSTRTPPSSVGTEPGRFRATAALRCGGVGDASDIAPDRASHGKGRSPKIRQWGRQPRIAS
ncbi:MAG TPA: Type 1 glutamine amidotransferase-like domain-containing protein, partial [Candidatus Limnocylindrales bacterium]